LRILDFKEQIIKYHCTVNRIVLIENVYFGFHVQGSKYVEIFFCYWSLSIFTRKP